MHACPYCNKKKFKTKGGLRQHQSSNKRCSSLLRQKFGVNTTSSLISPIPSIQQLTTVLKQTQINRAAPESLVSPPEPSNDHPNFCSPTIDQRTQHAEIDQTPDDTFVLDISEVVDDSSSESSNNPIQQTEVHLPSVTMRQDFEQYVDWARNNLISLSKAHKDAIALLIRLRKTKSALKVYDEMMEWHLRSNGLIRPNQSLSDCSSYVSQKIIFKQLRKRYNFPDKQYHQVREITLPHSGSVVNIVCNDAESVLQSLLTDPRINKQDYLFFNDDPFAPPPDEMDFVENLNTGRAFTKTHAELVTKPGKQILLPVTFCIDGAITGQFVDMPVTSVRMTLGIFTREAREKEHFWRALGCIPAYSKHISRGKRMFFESKHMDSAIAFNNEKEIGGARADRNVVKAQDLHKMLEAIFESYVKSQDSGFVWDLSYGETMCNNVEFVMFTPYFKVDTDEAEKLCGKFTSRTSNVKQLCRYCECPTNDSDKPFATFPLKKAAHIKYLCATKQVEVLRNMSQQCIKNFACDLRFGMHNDQGIHGACPMEMLHALSLGMFRYIRDCFFEQVGPDSDVANEFDAAATQCGDMISRQSDRELPGTRFGNGVVRGKLNAKDFPGILLCMSVTFRSTKFQEYLPRKREYFRNEGVVKDWQTLLDTLLQWEQWLKSDKISIDHVKRAQRKHRYLMYLMKKVGRRVKGMGLKIVKFHSIMHMADDILNFGAPMEFDTGSNESAHELEKVAAKLTQKQRQTFDVQTAVCLQEIHLLELAEAEINGRSKWNYYEDNRQLAEKPTQEFANTVSGAKYYTEYSVEKQKNIGILDARSDANQDLRIEQDLIDFIWGSQEQLQDLHFKVCVHARYDRDGLVFRSSTNFMKNCWRDWAIFDWGEEGELPCHIMGFVDLRKLPNDYSFSYQSIPNIGSGIYAIVETASYSENESELNKSEIVKPIYKIVGGYTGDHVSHRIFHLADCEAIVKEVAVVQDLDGQENAYFLIHPRQKWKTDFVSWLDLPHDDDIVYSSDEESDVDCEQANFVVPAEFDSGSDTDESNAS